jgi:hypothetical protein
VIDRIGKNYEAELDRFGLEASPDHARYNDVLASIIEALPDFDLAEIIGYVPKSLR